MTRFLRKTLAVLLGLTLGWIAAGYLPDSLGLSGRQSFADEVNHQHHDHSAPSPHHENTDGTTVGTHSEHHASTSHDDHHDLDEGQIAASKLKPQEGVDSAWYRKVLWAIAALWVAALLLGYPAWKLRGPDLPEAPHTHDDHAHHAAHDAHHPSTHAPAGGH